MSKQEKKIVEFKKWIDEMFPKVTLVEKDYLDVEPVRKVFYGHEVKDKNFIEVVKLLTQEYLESRFGDLPPPRILDFHLYETIDGIKINVAFQWFTLRWIDEIMIFDLREILDYLSNTFVFKTDKKIKENYQKLLAVIMEKLNQ